MLQLADDARERTSQCVRRHMRSVRGARTRTQVLCCLLLPKAQRLLLLLYLFRTFGELFFLRSCLSGCRIFLLICSDSFTGTRKISPGVRVSLNSVNQEDRLPLTEINFSRNMLLSNVINCVYLFASSLTFVSCNISNLE
jgi:hypothetical protein